MLGKSYSCNSWTFWRFEASSYLEVPFELIRELRIFAKYEYIRISTPLAKTNDWCVRFPSTVTHSRWDMCIANMNHSGSPGHILVNVSASRLRSCYLLFIIYLLFILYSKKKSQSVTPSPKTGKAPQCCNTFVVQLWGCSKTAKRKTFLPHAKAPK